PLACKTLGVLWLGSGGLGATAIATPWIAWGLGPRFTYARIFDRVFEASLLIAVVLAWRALDLGDAASIGFRSREAARDVGRGFVFGFVGLAVGLGLCALWGALAPALRFGAAKTLRKAVLGLAASYPGGSGCRSASTPRSWRRSGSDGSSSASVPRAGWSARGGRPSSAGSPGCSPSR